MVRHISTLLAVPSQAHTRLSPMGLTRSAPTVGSSSLRIGWQDSLVTHGPIALRCPGSGRFPPMNAPLISVSFPNIVRNSRSRPIECEFWKMLQGHVLHQKKSGTHSQSDHPVGVNSEKCTLVYLSAYTPNISPGGPNLVMFRDSN